LSLLDEQAAPDAITRTTSRPMAGDRLMPPRRQPDGQVASSNGQEYFALADFGEHRSPLSANSPVTASTAAARAGTPLNCAGLWFLNEARIAATLNHPNLVQTYDSGCEGGHYFLAMEYLRGEDLLGIVRALAPSKREMPLEVAVAIVLGVAAGLHYFHEKRDAAGQMLDLVHRDISPGNIFVTADGA